MGKVYGIDLGTTYSAIATLDDSGNPVIIENFDDSVPFLASAVYFPEGGDPVIGKEAKNQAETDPARVVQFVKRSIGKDDIKFPFDGVEYTPITISALILKRMKEYAESQGHEVKDVVITCPAYFGTEERNATKQAGEIAGLNVLNIVNEPTAAALNYCAREFQENRKILVYDLGGGTFDITLMQLSVDEEGKASISTIKTDGDDRLGGKDWDDNLFALVKEQYQKETGTEGEKLASDEEALLRRQIEDLKKSLSNLPKKSFSVNCKGNPVRIEVTREQFESVTADLVVRTTGFVESLLSDAGLTPDDIDTFLLVGGSTRMPMIKTAVENIFPGKVRFEDPDLAVAKGAALAAAIEWNENVLPEMVKAAGEKLSETGDAPQKINVPSVLSNGNAFTDIISRTFGLGVMKRGENGSGDEYVVDNLLFVGDESPKEVGDVYNPYQDNLDALTIPIFESLADQSQKFIAPCQDLDENPVDSDPALMVKYLGKVLLPLPPNTPRTTEIEIVFRIGTDGLQVRAVNKSTGESVEALIQSSNTMSKEEVEQEKKRFAGLQTRGQI